MAEKKLMEKGCTEKYYTHFQSEYAGPVCPLSDSVSAACQESFRDFRACG